MASVIQLIRHGEKPTEGVQGVQPTGQPSDHSLIPKGWERAGALGRLFVPVAGREQAIGLSVPQQLIAASPNAPGADPSEKSRREEETITPMAELIGISPVLDFGKGDEAKVAAFAKEAEGSVLIVWEHENIPKLANLIAPTQMVPTSWPPDRVDTVWVFRLEGDQNYSFEQIPQLLLAGDSADPIS